MLSGRKEMGVRGFLAADASGVDLVYVTSPLSPPFPLAPVARKQDLPRQSHVPADGRQYHPSRRALVITARESNPSSVQSAHRAGYEVQFRCEWFRAGFGTSGTLRPPA